ncbi:hypothetical protein DKM19_34340 [Streptosporangium sp. 'caverna']|nr:hypothetical protein DKM19_34340 [Streptosporangium sp. 'caverna']
MVDTLEDDDLNNLEEIRPGSRGRSEIRIIFVPGREAVFLVAGDKAGKWSRWYDEAIPPAESRYMEHRAEKKAEKTKEDRR